MELMFGFTRSLGESAQFWFLVCYYATVVISSALFSIRNGNWIIASTCSGYTNYDTKLTVYSSCDGIEDGSSCVGGDDDSGCSSITSEVRWQSVLGQGYIIMVHGFGNASGQYELSIGEVSRPPNDNFWDATDVGPLEVGAGVDILAFTNYEATVQPNEPTPGAGTVPGSSCNSQDGWCASDTEVQSSVWYSFVVDGPDCVDILWTGTNSPDLQFALYEVTDAELCDPANFLEVAANDDGGIYFSPEIVAASVESGKTYALQVDGFSGATATEGSIKIQDCSEDLDGDGVIGGKDLCPHSDTSEPFHINDCFPSNVNIDVVAMGGNVFANGCTPSQELSRLCFHNFKNPADKTVPGQIRMCTNAVLKEWIIEGIISEKGRGQIQKCLNTVCTTTCSADSLFDE